MQQTIMLWQRHIQAKYRLNVEHYGMMSCCQACHFGALLWAAAIHTAYLADTHPRQQALGSQMSTKGRFARPRNAA